MIERYQGPGGKRLLVEAIRGQPFVEGNEQLAHQLADATMLEQHEAEQEILTQGGSDNDLILVIAGRVEIRVNNRKVGERHSGQHVGEMALIDVTARRAASVVAKERTVVARLPEPVFSEIADQHARVWRLLSVEIGRRLRERGSLVLAPNDKPHVFIGSSREAIEVAKLIQACLKKADAVVRIWSEGVFKASNTTIETLEATAAMTDFAVLVFSPDDKVFSRKAASKAPRDNVIFELGLFMGAIKRERTFVVYPRGLNPKIPTDLHGVTFLTYSNDTPDSLRNRLKPVCRELLEVVKKKGPK